MAKWAGRDGGGGRRMSEDERELRFQDAIAKLKWWSEIIGMFSTWAIIIGIMFVSLRTIDRMPQPDALSYNFAFDMAHKFTFVVISAFFFIYTLRTAWLIYCWVSKMHNVKGGWFTKGTDYISTAIIVSALVVGMFSMATTIANMQVGAN
jgi:hypothetical protein